MSKVSSTIIKELIVIEVAVSRIVIRLTMMKEFSGIFLETVSFSEVFKNWLPNGQIVSGKSSVSSGSGIEEESHDHLNSVVVF